MQALLFEPGKGPELIDAEDFPEILGGEVEAIWPFKDLDVCLVMLCDREEQDPNRTLFERTLRGPFLVAGFEDDFVDIREEDAEAVEAYLSFAEEEYRDEPSDPFDEDPQEEESYGTIRVVDADTFYKSIAEEIE